MEDRLVVKYKFGLPYDKFYYGYTYKHPLYPNAPPGRTYYLLNILMYDQILSILTPYRNYMMNHVGIPKYEFPNRSDQISRSNDLKKMGDDWILVQNYVRKIELLTLKMIYEYRPTIKKSKKQEWEDCKTLLLSYADFVTKWARCSIGGIIIKCCHQPTVIVGDGVRFSEDSFLVLPIFQYMDIMNLIEETKYASEARQLFRTI